MIQEEIFIESPVIIHEDYTTERNKPLPNLIHGIIQSKIGFQLEIHSGERFDFPSEVTLATHTNHSTPDISIYPKKSCA